MKKNGGFTLIELLLGLAIMGMVLTLIFSVFHSGIQQGERTKDDIYLQQEANYVVTALRNAYLNHNNVPLSLSITNDQIILNGTTISDKYQYQAKINYNGVIYTNQTLSIQGSSPVMIEITFTYEGASYTLRTTLSKGV
ncbi:prepilin-type N-terminal cleavage/methylation domain-containing protein [Neobacillus sp. PS3-40]|uniref:type II secretion system protein n=1 Tax=Neobacillus sp. PS3-40 TaxID=3070679 RepID=UPI0027DF887C|nr:prepilin-type N-terminal cleavage/methylation domain-containing protein [Neobacillus sp. PS3-40]WML45560.1 prepilin-type N-terminal cleavage/methylation domain-containing protein [Neobacillus sp. PS3-40]